MIYLGYLIYNKQRRTFIGVINNHALWPDVLPVLCLLYSRHPWVIVNGSSGYHIRLITAIQQSALHGYPLRGELELPDVITLASGIQTMKCLHTSLRLVLPRKSQGERD